MTDDDYVECHRCRERVRFLPGVVGPERFIHVRTASHICAPICKHCGAPASNRIGNTTVGGDGMMTFRTSHFECDDCATKKLRIHHA